MLDLTLYPKALQLLMQTDGTVTELIKLLSDESIGVKKISENMIEADQKILFRRIFLQGEVSQKNWMYAESKVYLENLPEKFVKDLIEKTIPIGTLWLNYRMETFKQLIDQFEEVAQDRDHLGFPKGTKLLSRIYQVYNQNNLIMEITEKFPIKNYSQLMV
ncbi:MAG: chorismate pyruvate-lyase family protein [Marinicellaceae bacterium]